MDCHLNDYLHRIKHFIRWLYNQYGKKEEETISQSEWQTPSFARIKEKKTKRLTSYSETDIWDREELLTIVKYEPYLHNKAALTLFWDLDARNHEVTTLKIKIQIVLHVTVIYYFLARYLAAIKILKSNLIQNCSSTIAKYVM